MAIIILCFWSPSSKQHHDLHHHRLDTLISIVASWSSRQPLLLQLSLLLNNKVKHLHSVFISYNKATTICGSCQLRITSTKHDHLIQKRISHNVLIISHHNMPWKNKLDVLYFVVASFTWLLRASSKNHSYLCIKTTTMFRQACWFNLQQGPTAVKFDSTKVGEIDTRQPPLCKTSCMSVGGTSLMNVVM